MPRDPLIGQTIDGRYVIRGPLGQGGMATVYVAYQKRMNREVALKVLHPQLMEHEVIAERFLREAHVAGQLRHSNTITVHDAGKARDGTMYLVMELLDGRTLRDELDRGPMSALRVVNIGVQICRSLAEAHRHGVVHRDVKPENVFLTDEHGCADVVKVLDFGIVKLLDHPSVVHLTRSGTTIGTPGYMSPEALTAAEVGTASDLYSLGAVLYEALAGAPPFQGNTVVALGIAHLTNPLPAISAVNPNVRVPAAVEDVVRRLMARNPSDRPESATATIEALLSTMRVGAAEYRAFADTVQDVAPAEPGENYEDTDTLLMRQLPWQDRTPSTDPE